MNGWLLGRARTGNSRFPWRFFVLLMGIYGLLGCANSIGEREPAMDVLRLEAVLRDIAGAVESPRPGIYHLDFYGVPVACVASPEHNRMRLYTPVIAIDKVTGEQVRRMLDSNFHTALDARYATSEGFVYALFLHPLASLSESQLRSAVIQVASLAKTFGSSYSSGVLHFGEPGETL